MSKKIWILLRKSQYSKAMVGKAMERNKSNKQTDHDTFRRSWSNPHFIQTILYFSFASIKLKTRLS